MTVELWASSTFHADVTGWVAAVAAQHGWELRGTPEQPHNRPWSSALRYESTAGPLWFKVNGAGTAHEPALLAALTRLAPGLVAELLAIDSAKGWSLTRDAGPILREVAGPDDLWPRWESLLPRYAEAQILVAEPGSALSETGIPEASPRTLPGQVRTLVGELGSRPPDEGGLAPDGVRTLEALTPAYDAWCAELAASPIPVSIQHDDLHSGNICWPGAAEQARIIDWGDASLGYSLATMLCTLNSIAHHAELEIADPRVTRVRDAYLEPFADLAPRRDLVRYVDLARKTGCVSRALSWRAALSHEPVATHAELGFPVRGWLLELLET